MHPPPMSEEEFNKLANGPLQHADPEIWHARLLWALWKVLEASGGAGALAFRLFCADVEKAQRKIDAAVRRPPGKGGGQ